MSGVRMKAWLAKAAQGLVPPENLPKLQIRFLAEAIQDAPGERIRVPTNVSRRTRAVRAAQKLIAIGASLDDCREIIGADFCRSTYYRWRAMYDRANSVIDGIRPDHKSVEGMECGYVYALQFDGVDGESFVKIGRSITPKERARTIAGSTDLTLVSAACVAFSDRVGERVWCESSVEKAVHELLAEHRVELEWFILPGGIDQAIDGIIEASKGGFSRTFVTRV